MSRPTVRRDRPEVRLHLVGSFTSRAYGRRIRRLVARHSDWIDLHLDLSHTAVRRLLSANRYGIHAMEGEHFGLAPAEMATAGCIVWVRDGGGAVEIVGGEDRLVFHSAADAVAKISGTLGDPGDRDIGRRRFDSLLFSLPVTGSRQKNDQSHSRKDPGPEYGSNL